MGFPVVFILAHFINNQYFTLGDPFRCNSHEFYLKFGNLSNHKTNFRVNMSLDRPYLDLEFFLELTLKR